jgi:hypothetical protein
VLSWLPYTCRKAELGHGRLRELIVPFGVAGYIVLFEIVDDAVVVGAVRHQREEDYRHWFRHSPPLKYLHDRDSLGALVCSGVAMPEQISSG